MVGETGTVVGNSPQMSSKPSRKLSAAHRWSRRETATVAPFWEVVCVALAFVVRGEERMSTMSSFQE
jgi:hypothetical protein